MSPSRSNSPAARDATKRAAEELAGVGLGERLHHYPSQLSGGEQQRVALARAMAPDPAILVADEPTGNLDEATGKQIVDLLFAKHLERGMTLVLVTHDTALAQRCDRVVRLRSGPRRRSGHRPALGRDGVPVSTLADTAPRGSTSSLAIRYALRELRSGLRGFYVFMACIALGVMAIAGVGSVRRKPQRRSRPSGPHAARRRYFLCADAARGPPKTSAPFSTPTARSRSRR